ncbi:MAG: tetratricopeptide repeat protein [Chitinispirillaceae bacterium]|nr:tetratricopeptide repeat protein [Chitinispirillaceae bacterium]
MDQWPDHNEFFDKAQDLIELGLFEEAKLLLDKYAHAFSEDWELYFIYSRLSAEQNKPDEAIAYLQTALKLDPENPDCLLGMFYAYAMLHRMNEAGAFLIEADNHHPDNEPVVSALIWYYAETNQLDKSISCFERIRDKGLLNPETLRNAGIAYDRAGFYENAESCFLAALEINPHYDEVRELLSDLNIAGGKPESAIALYEQALAASPNNIRYLSRLAYCHSQNGQPEKAVTVAKESIRLFPNSPIGYIDLAYALLNNDDLDPGLEAAEKAINISPLDAESFRVKAIILSEKGMDREAEEAFESALSLDDDNLETLRDYYNHFRLTGDYVKMERIALRAVAGNDPSCVEDFWFLADYFREKKAFGRAFHFLHRAYVLRPGENDLIPMMVDVLVAKKHVRLAQPLLQSYVERAGWTPAMDQLAEYPVFRKKRWREGLDFLRFLGGSESEYRRHLFNHQAKRSISFSLMTLLAVTTIPVYVLLGKEGLIGLLSFAFFFTGVSFIVTWFRKRVRYQTATAQ